MIKTIRSLRTLLPVFLALILALAGCGQYAAPPATAPPAQPPPTQPPPAAAAPGVTITTPKASATVAPGSVSVSIDVSNFQIQPPGSGKGAGKGHVHYYRDVTIPTDPSKGAVTPADAIGPTYQAVQTKTATWNNVPAGTHTFGVQLVNDDHKPFSPAITSTVTVTVGGAAGTTTPPAAAAAPTVKFTSPASGATLPAGSISATVDVGNFKIVPPGAAKVPGEGHIHYYLDVTIPTEPGKAAVTAPGTYKAVQSTTVTWDNVAGGSHTLGVQLVNSDHTPLSPPVTATVKVTVSGAAAPPPTPTGPSVKITSPAAGATLSPGTITVSVDISSFTIQPPGGTPQAGYGHIHYYRDVTIPTDPTKGAVTPADASGVTYKAVQTMSVTWDNVPEGTHTFGVQLVNTNHTPFDPPITATVTVTVGTAPAGGGTIPGY